LDSHTKDYGSSIFFQKPIPSWGADRPSFLTTRIGRLASAMDGTKRINLIRYMPHVLVATAAVVLLPVGAVWTLERAGHIQSPAISALLGAGLSVAAATLGSALWVRSRGARDLLFGELMIWGWLRRVYSEHRLKDIARFLHHGHRAATPEHQIEVLKRLASVLEARDPYTHGHTRRVARHAYEIARNMHLSDDVVRKVHTAAAVHDVGKLYVPLEILNKPGKLTNEEFAAVKEHSITGANMVSEVEDDELTEMVRHHHERLDGRGYPDGLSGTDIPLGARIIAVADTFDAITSSRSYRSACRHKKALDILRKEAGTQLDPDAVHAFLAYYTGRGTRAWWAVLTTMPQRLGAWVASWLPQASGTVASAIAAGGAAVTLATTSAAAVPAAQIADGPARPAPAAAAAAADSDDASGRTDDRRGADEGAERKPGRARTEGASGPRDSGPGDSGSDDPDPGTGSEPPEPPPGDGGDPPPGDGGDPPPDDSPNPIDDVADGGGKIIDDTVDGVGDAVDDVNDTVDNVTDDVDDVVDGLLAADGVKDAVGDVLP
jgi:HD-GYP domain-containing protein (c-di-GMP phosphodiesterase class II)